MATLCYSQLASYIGSRVSVTLPQKDTCTGFVLTVDPFSNAIFLLEQENGADDSEAPCIKLSIVLHAVGIGLASTADTKTSLDDLIASTNFFEEGRHHTVSDTQHLEERRLKVEELLRKHQLEVQKDGDALLLFGGLLKITAPYDADSCLSSNEILLSRMQNLLRNI